MESIYRVGNATPFASSDDAVRFVMLDVRRDWQWVSARLPCHLVEDTGGILAIDRHGNYAGAIVFDSFTATACCCHILIENPMILRHGFLQHAAKAVFVHAKRHVLIGLVPADNEKAIRFNKKIGWQEIYRVKDGYSFGVDYVVFEMRRETCRWLSKEERHDG